jgi:uncharacterized protein (TIGR03435 family)
MKMLNAMAFGILAATLALAQAPTAPPKLEFEVASVRLSQPSGPNRVDAGLRMDGSQAHFGSLTLKDYIAMAYRITASRVSGPEWLASQRFDISAKLPDGGTREQIPQMLQSLLADRFQVKFHRETKELPAYALVLGKSPLKLTKTPDTEQPDTQGAVNVAVSGSAAGVSVDLGNGSYYTFANNQFEFKKTSMNVVAERLERFMDRPIVNMTALTGNYDLTLPLTPEDYRALLVRSAVNAGVDLPPPALRLLDAGPPVSLFDAIDQLGLHLDARKLPLDMIVVDSALQTPTDN